MPVSNPDRLTDCPVPAQLSDFKDEIRLVGDLWLGYTLTPPHGESTPSTDPLGVALRFALQLIPGV